MGIPAANAIKACAAAVGCAFSLAAGAQSNVVQSSLDRAIRLPLEIIWLQSEVQADMWRAPAMAHALQGCTKSGAPREGCGLNVRNTWRYYFDANSAVRPTPIVVSSLNIPNAPFASGRLNLTGSGQVYLVTSSTEAAGGMLAAPRGVILLAAGSTVQLVDASYPSIQIEVSAPADQPLFLGNLAAAEVGRIFALLLQPGIQSATAADIVGGKVALRSTPGSGATPTQLAATPKSEPFSVASVDLSALSGRVDFLVAERKAVEPEPVIAFTQDFTPLASIFETSTALPFSVAAADLSVLSGAIDFHVAERKPVAAEPVIAFTQDFTPLASILETSTALPFSVAAADLSALSGAVDFQVAERSPVQAEPVIAFTQDFSPIAAAVESSTALPFSVAAADLSALSGAVEFLVAERKAVEAEAVIAFTQDYTPLAGVFEAATPLPFSVAAADLGALSGRLDVPAEERAKAQVPVQLALAAPLVAPAARPASSDIAKMRAEIEAEIAREQERLAQMGQGRAKQFRFGT